MYEIIKINENIYRATMPYKTIFTTVYVIKTENGALLFDSASYDRDAKDYIIPLLSEAAVDKESLNYVFISHNHGDHSGGLASFLKEFPAVTVLSRSPELKATLPEYSFRFPNDGDVILDTLKVIPIPGHTNDSCALLDTRTNTLITGDCMQFYGIVGNENWGTNIFLPKEHLLALDKLKELVINEIYTAHDYYPYGYKYIGKEAVATAIDTCIESVLAIRNHVKNNLSLTNEELTSAYNTDPNKPTISTRVMDTMRRYIEEGKL